MLSSGLAAARREQKDVSVAGAMRPWVSRYRAVPRRLSLRLPSRSTTSSILSFQERLVEGDCVSTALILATSFERLLFLNPTM
jgi:hypothetical protein